MSGDYDDGGSGPYCKHWDHPESCSECGKAHYLESLYGATDDAVKKRAVAANEILNLMDSEERKRFLAAQWVNS